MTGDLLQQALEAEGAGDLPRALDLLRRALEAAPVRPDLWFALGRLSFISGLTDDAAAIFAELAKSFPDDPALLLLRARLALSHMDHPAALALLDRLVGLAPDMLEAQWLHCMATPLP